MKKMDWNMTRMMALACVLGALLTYPMISISLAVDPGVADAWAGFDSKRRVLNWAFAMFLCSPLGVWLAVALIGLYESLTGRGAAWFRVPRIEEQ